MLVSAAPEPFFESRMNEDPATEKKEPEPAPAAPAPDPAGDPPAPPVADPAAASREAGSVPEASASGAAARLALKLSNPQEYQQCFS